MHVNFKKLYRCSWGGGGGGGTSTIYWWGSPGAVKPTTIVLINLHKTYPNSADRPP